MNREKVDSSQILSIGYDPLTRQLEVEFKGEAIYQYENVEPDTHAFLMEAKSVGRFFGQVIKPNPAKYPFKKICGPGGVAEVRQDQVQYIESVQQNIV